MSSSVRTSSIVVRPGEFRLTPEQAESLTGGTWIGERATVQLRGAALDSRQAGAGSLFACLIGERVDGHDFAAAAVAAGASLILASRQVTVSAPLLLVADVPAALAKLASEYRRRFDPACTWIAIGGANGKTTTKELIHEVLSSTFNTCTTRGNLNNHIGIPITLLSIKVDTTIAVIEMGANHQKEIASYCRFTLPTHGIITNCGKAHLEGFGGIEGVQKGKGELFDYLKANNGTAFVMWNYDF